MDAIKFWRDIKFENEEKNGITNFLCYNKNSKIEKKTEYNEILSMWPLLYC